MRENCLSVNTLASTSYVALRTPLPCITGAHGAGFVHAIAKDRFLIRFANHHTSKTLSDNEDVLTITTEQGTHFTFSTSIASGELDQDGMSEARVPDSDHANQVSDLLTLLRKSQHINICNNDDVEAKDKYTGFSDVRLMPCALPDFDADEVVTKTSFLGRNFDLPLLITGMTGGLEQGAEINLRLAKAAAHFNIPMGVGSQRIALENRNYEKIFAVKEAVPSVFLIGNIGMAQLKEKNPVDACQRAIAGHRHLRDVLAEQDETRTWLTDTVLARLFDPRQYLGLAELFVARAIATAEHLGDRKPNAYHHAEPAPGADAP